MNPLAPVSKGPVQYFAAYSSAHSMRCALEFSGESVTRRQWRSLGPYPNTQHLFVRSRPPVLLDGGGFYRLGAPAEIEDSSWIISGVQPSAFSRV